MDVPGKKTPSGLLDVFEALLGNDVILLDGFLHLLGSLIMIQMGAVILV